MTKIDFHAQLHKILQNSRRMVMDYLHSLSEVERGSSGTWEVWAPKDHLSHINYWERRVVEMLSYLSRGQNPPVYPHYEECNRQNFDETTDKTVEALIREFEGVQGSIALVLNRFSEEDLRTVGKHPFDKETTLLAYIIGNYYSHPLTHLADAYLKLGDATIVNRLGDQMVRDILSLDDSPRMRGTVLYNRACLFALTGKGTQALENLRQSIGYRPDLKQWAKDDTDLASLREMPEFIALITD